MELQLARLVNEGLLEVAKVRRGTRASSATVECRGNNDRKTGAGNTGCFKFAHKVPDAELQDLPR
jgi:hypothetical protein